MRTRGEVLEMTSADLALHPSEAASLMSAMGVDSAYDLDELMSVTEGWPVGVYLAGLAMRAGSTPAPTTPPHGDDLYIADYVRQEMLDRLSASKRSFLIRTSILDELSGPLCDHVLETTGSARTLERLEQSNLLIMRLDHTREWHRYHQMFQEFLRAELEVNEPEIVARLHSRAAEWFEAHGRPETALRHAQAAGETARVARLIELIGRVTYTTGRSETVLGWVEWLEGQDQLDRHPGAAAVGALAAALVGESVRAERWTAGVDTSNPLALMVRALRSTSGIDGMLADVRQARDLMPPGSPWLPGTYAVEGLGVMWEGDRAKADSLFHRAVTMSEPLLATATATTALAGRSLIALEERDWAGADTYCHQSLRIITDNALEGYATSALTFALGARLARKRNDIVRARDMLALATLLRPHLNMSLAGISVQSNLELARGYLELSDVAAARLVLRDAQALLEQVPDLGVLGRQCDEMLEALSTMGPGKIGPSALTTAELRLLPLLSSHLTFPEIAERLFISRHTVKTQAMSIYRKMGASSRSEAVKVAFESGFLGTTTPFIP
jgi:LuxR family maltose regulon positive regulatory protein